MGNKKKGIVTPSDSLIWKGTKLQFTLNVNKKKVEARWSLSEPEVGTIDPKTGEFEAHDEYRYGVTKVLAESLDGKYEGSTEVRIMVGRGLMSTSIYFADDFLKIPTLKWNDPLGRRAAKLILDAVEQLPKSFLKKVGQVALVRTDWLKGIAGGMHLPLPGRVILLAESTFQQLTLSKGITNQDKEFVRTVIHEMAHCVLANECLSDGDRWSLILTLAAGLGAAFIPGIWSGITGATAAAAIGWGAMPAAAVGSAYAAGIVGAAGVMVVADYSLVLSRYYANPWAQHDLAYKFAEKTGWQVRDPNPVALFWGGKIPPNAVTGFRFIGPAVGLENKLAPKSQDVGEWRSAGFYRPYAGTDVHEDFADIIATALLGGSSHAQLLKKTRYKAALQVIFDQGILGKKYKPVDVGQMILGYSKKKKKPADFEEFGVFLSLYAGTTQTKKSSSAPKAAAKSVKKSSGQTMNIKSAEFNLKSAPESAPADEVTSSESDKRPAETGAPMAEGYARQWDQEEAEETFIMAERIEALHQTQQHFAEKYGAVIGDQRELLGKLPFGLREGSVIELLISANCHGEGLRFIGRRAEGDDAPAGVIEEIKTGDMLFDSELNWWLVARTQDGRATEIIGTPQIDEYDKLSKGFAADKLLYYWRPSVDPRIWKENQTEDETNAFADVVRLWGKETSPNDYSLFKTGSFITQIASYFGLRIRGIAGEDDRAVLDFAGGKGRLLKTEKPCAVDFIRFKNGLWAFVIRENPLEVIVQGGGKGLMKEDELAAKILPDVKTKQITHIWRILNGNIE